MASSRFGRDLDRRRLRLLLAVLLVALAAPTAAVIWQAYGRLKWEAFHVYRNQAEELVRRIDSNLTGQVAEAEARRFADFAFLNVTGGAAANVLQRSPLSAFPVDPALPGLIGYFQVDVDGRFSTPLLPDAGTDPAAVGIDAGEYAARVALTDEIRRILADNELVGERVGGVAAALEAPEAGAPLRESAASAPVDAELTARYRAEPGSPERQKLDPSFSQQAFDELSRAAPAERVPADAPAVEAENRANVLGKVQDLRLDDALSRKSEIAEEVAEAKERRLAGQEAPAAGADRARRLEQSALPVSLAAAEADAAEDAPADLRITAFESEVDPYEFSLLDSGHFVLFRKVWRDGERHIQGALIEQRAFLAAAVETAFRATALSAMSDLAVVYREDVIDLVAGRPRERYLDASGLQGALLYRSRLSAPLDALELVVSIRHLPRGPGAAVLGWTTALIAAVFIAGFLALYRLGLGQIRLARQQQDFVSAVSHELKTPLTSIRMYGEMLKEGWVDEGRRRQYYEYIHDESERLARLIENVLRLSSITRNDPHYDLRPHGVGELTDQLRSRLSDQAGRAGFELAFDVGADVRAAEILVDEDCFLQIVINLVDNAIKFSKKSGASRIDIGAVAEGRQRVRFTVRDYGPGVPRDQMKKIFGLFYRTESELTRETVGTGIGLAIVHQLTTAMSGKVDVVNRDPGAEFRLSFPIRSG